jgi:hypothetical protein
MEQLGDMTSEQIRLIHGVDTPPASSRRGIRLGLLLASMLAMLLACAPTLSAQRSDTTSRATTQPSLDTVRGAVTGTVYDSLRQRPLVGATVVIDGTMYSAKTDGIGRYHIDSVPVGQYRMGFFHPVLDSLGLASAVQNVTVQGGATAHVDMGVPSVATISAAVCPPSARQPNTGIVAGVVRDANTGAPLPGAVVVLSWMGMRVSGGRLINMLQATNATADKRGSYWVCGVPSGTTITVRATSGTHSSGQAELQVVNQGLALRDISLVMAAADGAAPNTVVGGVARTGTATLIATVKSPEGIPLEHAQASVLGTTISGTSDAAGIVRLANLPPGTQTMEVRMIGFRPHRMTVDLRPKDTTRVTVVIHQRVVVLDSMKVIGKRRNDWLQGFDRRQKQGFGHFLTRKDIEDHAVIDLTDAFRTVPGVRVVWTGSDYTLAMSRATSLSGSCPITYYIDGMPVSDFNINWLQPPDVEAIEIYQPGQAPPQFSGGMGEGAV